MASEQFLNFTASQANQEAKKLKSLKLKLLNLDKSIQFNKQCLALKVTPNYVPIKINGSTPSATQSARQCKILWIKNEIKFAYMKKQRINTQLLDIHLRLSNFWHPAEWEAFTTHLHDYLKFKAMQKQAILDRKIKALINKQLPKDTNQNPVNNTSFHPRVINRTTVKFSKKEMELLEKGFKFNCNDTHTPGNIKQLITEVEIACDKLPPTQTDIIKSVITNEALKIIDKENSSCSQRSNLTQPLKSIKNKIKTENLVVTKADKGNSIVILNKNEYVEKTMSFLDSNNIQEINKDPTNKFQNQIKQALKGIDLLFTQAEKYKLTVKNPKLPTLRSLPKIHKQSCPIRPIVNFREAPSYKICRELNKLLREKISLENDRSVKNSIELTTKLNTLSLSESTRIVSFDITNMYTNIPVDEAITIIEENLLHSNPRTETAEIVDLLRTVLHQNSFGFNGKIYQQNEGLAMGSPLSGLTANIFLNQLENKFLKHPNTKGILHWSRYVDDVICFYDSHITSEDHLLEILNSLHHSIKFTKESEIDRKLNFLDISITRKDNILSYSIYRKPTQTSHTIDHHSNHPITHKMAGLNTMVNRAIKIPMNKDDFKKEINTIKQIAKENNHDPKIIDRLITKHNNKNKEHKSNNKYAVLSFVNNNSYKIANILKQQGIKVAFKTHNTLHSHIHRTKLDTEKRDPYASSGVYKLTCQENHCKAEYIGLTSRAFKVRYKEHRKAIQYGKYSAFGEHVYDHKHTFTDIQTDLTILHRENNVKTLRIKEAIEIHLGQRDNPDNLNEHTHLKNSPLFTLLGHHHNQLSTPDCLLPQIQ